MHLVVFSSQDKLKSEVYIVNTLFRKGLKTLHLKKPKFSKKKLKNYISKIDEKYHNRIIIHSHYSLALKFNLKGIHISKNLLKKKIKSKLIINFYKLLDKKFLITRTFSNTNDLINIPPVFSYVFLSPIYFKTEENVKKYYFDIPALSKRIQDNHIEIYASGRIDINDFADLKNLNFKGISLLKTIWYSNNQPLDKFLEAKKTIEKLNEINT